MSASQKKLPLLQIVTLVFLTDRLTKFLTAFFFKEGEGFPVVPGFFHITRVSNHGAAFGILKDQEKALLLVSILCVIALGVYLLRQRTHSEPSRFGHIPWALVLAGAAGNLYDRVRFGYVVDLLDFRIWPVFNIADSAITVGAFLVAAELFLKPRRPGKSPDAPDPL